MDLPNLWLWSGLRIGPQLMDGRGAGRNPPRSKKEEEEEPRYARSLNPHRSAYPRQRYLSAAGTRHGSLPSSWMATKIRLVQIVAFSGA